MVSGNKQPVLNDVAYLLENVLDKLIMTAACIQDRLQSHEDCHYVEHLTCIDCGTQNTSMVVGTPKVS